MGEFLRSLRRVFPSSLPITVRSVSSGRRLSKNHYTGRTVAPSSSGSGPSGKEGDSG